MVSGLAAAPVRATRMPCAPNRTTASDRGRGHTALPGWAPVRRAQRRLVAGRYGAMAGFAGQKSSTIFSGGHFARKSFPLLICDWNYSTQDVSVGNEQNRESDSSRIRSEACPSIPGHYDFKTPSAICDWKSFPVAYSPVRRQRNGTSNLHLPACVLLCGYAPSERLLTHQAASA